MKAFIRIDNPHRAVVKGVKAHHIEKLDEKFAIDNPNAEHIKRYARMGGRSKWAKLWDGKQHLFNVQTCAFPVGFVSDVRRFLEKRKYTVQMQDNRACARQAPKAVRRVSADMLKEITLRDYQLKAVRKAIAKRGGVARLATNAGKTAVGAALIKAIDGVTLYMVPNTKLITQTTNEFARFLGISPDEIGVIRGGEFNPKRITIGIVNSLVPGSKPKWKAASKTAIKQAMAEDQLEAPPEGEDLARYIKSVADNAFKERMRAYNERKKKLAAYLKTVEVFIPDECHHTAAKTWREVSRRCTATWRFGLSATPLNRTDGRSIFVKAICGPVIANITNKELIARGISAKPTINIVEIARAKDPQGKTVHPDGRYSDVYKAGIVRNTYFHKRIVRDSLGHVELGRPTLILVKEHEHGHALVQAFDDVGFGRVDFVHGNLDDETFEQAKENFSRGHNKVLIATPVFGEGQHVPDIRSLVIADDFESVILILQRIGRGLRKKKGENKLYVTDYAHTTHRYLSDHSLTRIELYEQEGFHVRY